MELNSTFNKRAFQLFSDSQAALCVSFHFCQLTHKFIGRVTSVPLISGCINNRNTILERSFYDFEKADTLSVSPADMSSMTIIIRKFNDIPFVVSCEIPAVNNSPIEIRIIRPENPFPIPLQSSPSLSPVNYCCQIHSHFS